MARENLYPLVHDKAAQYFLNPKLLDAIIQVESSYNPKATRFEPKYKHLYAPDLFAKRNLSTIGRECREQRTSWGLLQIMGGTARWLGFKGVFSELFDPNTNLEFACRYLGRLKARYKLDDDLIAAYNAGAARKDDEGRYLNQGYVDKVNAIYLKELTR